MRNLYLFFAIVGTVIPCYFLYQFFLGGDPHEAMNFMSALFVNGATSAFTVDLFISSFAFWVFMWSRQDRGPGMIPYVIMNLFVGLSLALPAYLYVASGERYANA